MTTQVLSGVPSIGPARPVVETNGPIDPSATYRRLQDSGLDRRPAWIIAAPVIVVLVAAGVLIYATTNKTPAPATAPLTSSSDFQNGPASGTAPPPSEPAKIAAMAPQAVQAPPPVAPVIKPTAQPVESRPAAHVARAAPHHTESAPTPEPSLTVPAPPAPATIAAPAVNAPVPAATPSLDPPAATTVNPGAPQA